MNSVFPLDFPLTSDGRLTDAFRALGAASFAEAVSLVSRLPYGRNCSKDDAGIVLREGRGTCSTKHAVLKLLADEHSREEVRLMLGLYRMQAENTPLVGTVLAAAGLDYVPEAHVYLHIGEAVVDCTTAASGGAAFLQELMKEQEISPRQIGAWKVSHHRAFLQDWMSGNFSGTLDELWAVREACIAALGAQ